MNSFANIRNFCIIAHIDHGKSTLADRFLEMTGTMQKRDMTHGQMLDMMDLEQERGITIKLQPVRMEWSLDGQAYILNMIDTPGHVDFSYEVSRSLAACEGAILLIDATQGIQAQTLANSYLALEHNLTLIPILNKIDLASSDVERCKREIEQVFGIPGTQILAISAKYGQNVDLLLKKIIKEIPHPQNKIQSGNNSALIFDSVYDSYKGIVAFVRVFEGSFFPGDRVLFLNTDTAVEIMEVGYFRPKYEPADRLNMGEVGYIVTGLKSVRDARVGDTICSKRLNNGKSTPTFAVKPIPLPGYKKVKPFVFAGVFCAEGQDYHLLRDALEKLSLNDSALSFEPEQSGALGHGFRCGFLGLLHMDIVQERLEREYNLDLIFTAPSVSYIVITSDGEELKIENPSFLPDPSNILVIKEPWVHLEILTPKEYLGGIMKLTQDLRGIHKKMEYLDLSRVLLEYEIPLSSIVIDFHDRLKSLSSGYASMNYEMMDYREGDLIKMDILVAGDKIEAFAHIVHSAEAMELGRDITLKLKDLIPRQMFEIPIQAAINSKVIARETVKAFRKDVTAKLYGGDRTRKDKLLNKQKEGKKRMRNFGKVEIPQKAFLEILKRT